MLAYVLGGGGGWGERGMEWGGEGLGGGLVGGREEDWHMYSVTLLIRTV